MRIPPPALLVDIDDTLYAYAPAEAAGIAAAAAHFPEHDLKSVYFQARETLVRERPQRAAGRCRTGVFLRTAEMLQLPQPLDVAARLETTYRAAFLAAMVPHAAVIDYLRMALKTGSRLCAVTDTLLHPQLQKLEALQVRPWFDGVVTADETGVEKPDPLMFHTALRKLNARASDALMIGDNLERDINGARACGIAAVRVVEGRFDD